MRRNISCESLSWSISLQSKRRLYFVHFLVLYFDFFPMRNRPSPSPLPRFLHTPRKASWERVVLHSLINPRTIPTVSSPQFCTSNRAYYALRCDRPSAERNPALCIPGNQSHTYIIPRDEILPTTLSNVGSVPQWQKMGANDANGGKASKVGRGVLLHLTTSTKRTIASKPPAIGVSPTKFAGSFDVWGCWAELKQRGWVMIW